MFLFQRVKRIANEVAGSETKLANILNIHQRTLNGYLKDSRQDNLWPILPRILEIYPQISRAWLYFGEGEMLAPQAGWQTVVKPFTTAMARAAQEAGGNAPPTGIKPFIERQGRTIDDGREPVRIPVIGSVAGGPWTPVYDQFAQGEVEEWILVSTRVSGAAFALRVDGDSMEPEFHENDVIVVDPEAQAVNGSYIIAKIPKSDSPGDEGEATFKQLVLDGPNTYLKAKNKAYSLIDVTGKPWRIVGVVKCTAEKRC